MEINNAIAMGKSGAGKQPRINVLCDEFDLEQLSTGNIFREYLGNLDNVGYSGDSSEFWDEHKEWFIPDSEIKEKLQNILPKNPDNWKPTILGAKAKYFVVRGLFVPDKITNKLFASYFAKLNYQGIVLDGYPRTMEQAKFLLDLVDEKDTSLDLTLLVQSNDQAIIERITGRRMCPECDEVYHMDHKPPKDGRYCKKCGAEVIQRDDDTKEKMKTRLSEFHEKTEPVIKFLKKQDIPLAKVSGNLEEFTEENVYKSVMNAVEKALS